MLEYNNVTPNYLMMDLALKNKSGVAYAQYLVVRIILYGILGYRNDVPSIVRDKKFEITNGTLNFHTVSKLSAMEPLKFVMHFVQLNCSFS